MSQYRYKGRGFIQTTGRSNMAISNSPITISNISAAQLKGLNSSSLNQSPWDISFNDNTHSNLKKYEMYESTEDVVALSCAADRLFREKQIYYKVTDRELYNKIEQQDRDKAKEIKDYYSKKVMMLKLKGTGQLSPFRTDMNQLIHTDGLLFKESMIGIAYWLPKFYKYDLELDEVKSQVVVNQNFDDLNKQGLPGTRKLISTLSPIKRLHRATKRNKFHEYWMKDDVLNAGVVLHLEDKNQLQHLWDYVFENQKEFKISGTYTRRHRDGFEYFSVANWELDRS